MNTHPPSPQISVISKLNSVTVSQNLNIREGRHFLWEKKLGGRRWWCRNVLMCVTERRWHCFSFANWDIIYPSQLDFHNHFLGSLLPTPKIRNSIRLLFASNSFDCNKIQAVCSMTAWNSHSVHWNCEKKYQLGY